MRRRGSGTTGQYQASCEQGHCALTGRRATSKLEGQIFTLLDYVLGPGKYDWRSQVCGQRLQIDMVFTLPDDRTLVVEYDGAHWHSGKEERDWRKARLMEEGWKGGKCVVMRIRENPLMRLEFPDVWVPARANAVTCVQLVLLHLVHVMPADFDVPDGRVTGLLRAGRQPLARSKIECGECRHIATFYMPQNVLRPAVSRKPWIGS
jgi:hypothetical protein